MGRGIEIISALKELHPERNIEACLTAGENATQFMVLEGDDKIAYLKLADEGKSAQTVGFRVENPNRRYINLLATDHCVFTEEDSKRCDFLLFDDVYLCFVELKLEVTRKPSEKIHEAQEQLGQTIVFLRNSIAEKTRRFFNFELEAYVVMRSHVYPRHRVGMQTRRVAFSDQYGVKFFEQDFKEFDQ